MNLEKRFSLAIFDMDGVLVDSEKAFKHACQDALLQWGVHAERKSSSPIREWAIFSISAA